MRIIEKIRQIVRDDETHLVALTRHFFDRFFDIELVSKDAEVHLGVVHILALLAVPAIGYTFFVTVAYGYVYWHFSWDLYNAIGITVQCRYLLFSMVVIGIVAVVEWDRLFPDAQDYAILMPLPLRLQDVFCAKVAALVVFLGLFILAVAGIPTLCYPLIEVGGLLNEGSLGHLVWLITAHGIAVFSGCLFMFLFFVALQGLLINLLSPSQCRKISVYIQGLATVFLVCQLFLLPLVPELLPVWEKAQSQWLYALPPMWFLGLYRTLLGSPNALFHSLARISILAFLLSAAVAVATYLVSYRRYSRMSFESTGKENPSRFGPAALVSWLLDRLWVKQGPERATFYFVLKTLARSAKHRLYFGGYVAVGLAFALMGILTIMVHSAHGNLSAVIMRPGEALLSIPLIISFFTLVGMRAAFGFPAALSANWIFQITDENKGIECLAGARKAMIVLGIAPLFAVTLAVFAALWGVIAALLSVAFGVLLSLILMELLLCSFHKIPFTCSHLPGKANLPLLGGIYMLVFMVYAYSMAALETWMFHVPVAWIVMVGLELAAFAAIVAYRKRLFSDSQGVEFEDEPIRAVQTLDLTA